ncbi:hypothetical protein PpBr36_02032 [Pyricularia pennisetigena]|uniref:hypothetical protein n=1 Tax=Pyricularia pennisetigena TaxID=1578925 RepID=UPI00115349B2|nr:hypothetical protein PpBr36_02032 [Pyricularia pennisetigena]TLS29144.1 hypothetical protein PpBr36_02032 [Pyricularia pennisetigena]
MLDIVIQLGPDSAKDQDLCASLRAHALAAERSRNCHNSSVIARAEEAVASNAELLAQDEHGNTWLSTGDDRWSAGRFEAVTVADLRERAEQARAATSPSPGAPTPRLRMWVLGGESIATDIGSLQATAGDGALFQVASQFNCLESPAAEQLVPVRRYVHDCTQGPRAAVGAFPAALLRHYRAPGPDGQPFVQTADGRQLDLLDEAVDPSLGGRRNGYLNGYRARDTAAIVDALRSNQDKIKVGVQTEAEVVLGAEWYGAVEGRPRIAQVFTSTVAGGFYGGERAFGASFPTVCAILLRAAYRGTLLAAAAGRRQKVVLTLIGGGVFLNDLRAIWTAIAEAAEHVEPLLSSDLDVFVNVRELGAFSRALPADEPLKTVQRWGGAVIRFDLHGQVVVQR